MRSKTRNKMKKKPRDAGIKKASLGAKGIKKLVGTEGKRVYIDDAMSFPKPRIIGVTIKSHRVKNDEDVAGYHSILHLDTGKEKRLNGLQRLRIVYFDMPDVVTHTVAADQSYPSALQNPMALFKDAAGRSMAVFKLSSSERNLLERRGVDPWDLVGYRPEELQRLLSGLRVSEQFGGYDPHGDPETVSLSGKSYGGWTVEEITNDSGKMPLSANLHRYFDGSKITIKIRPIGARVSGAQRYSIILDGGDIDKSFGKAILIKDAGLTFNEDEVSKVLKRAARETTSWAHGRGKGWMSIDKSATINPSKSKKNKSIKFTKNPMRKRPFEWDKDRVKKGGFPSMAAAKRAETLHKMGEKVSPTMLSSLRGMGRLPKSDGSFSISPKYK